MCFAFLCYGLRYITRGKRVAFYIRYEKWKSTFSKENQILLPLYVLNISMQQVLKKKTKKNPPKHPKVLGRSRGGMCAHQLKSELGC